MIRQRATIAGLELFQPLPPVAAQRLVSGNPLAEQQPLDEVDVLNPLILWYSHTLLCRKL
jgi:hypothetical protein